MDKSVLFLGNNNSKCYTPELEATFTRKSKAQPFNLTTVQYISGKRYVLLLLFIYFFLLFFIVL